MATAPAPLKPKRSCPICGKPQDAKFEPFCSKRCTDIDLSRWLKGIYAIPGEATDENDETTPRSSGRRNDEGDDD